MKTRKKRARLGVEALEHRLVMTTHTWTGLGANNNWGTAANWDIGAPNEADAVLVFPAGAARKDTVNNFTAGTTFDSISVENGYSLSGNRIRLVGGDSLRGDAVVTSKTAPQFGTNFIRLDLDIVAPQPGLVTAVPFHVLGGTLQIGDTAGGTISGSGGVVKDGAGALVLGRANSYIGDTVVEEGVLEIRNGAALGSTFGKTVVRAGATLQLSGGIQVGTEELRLEGSSGLGAVRNLSDVNSWAGRVTLASAGPVAINVNSGQLTLRNQIVAGNGVAGALTKDGIGTLVFSGDANTYAGTTTVNSRALVLNKRLGVTDLTAIAGPLVIGDGVGQTGSAAVLLSTSNQIADNAAVTINRDGALL